MGIFAEVIQNRPFQLDRAALGIAQEMGYETLDVEAFLAQLAYFAQAVSGRIKPDDATSVKLRCLNKFLFDEQAFKGNEENYYDPRNSFLNEVLVRRMGIPITLSMIYISVARRMGLPAYGVGLPGHFIVGCQSENGALYLDPFYQGLFLSEEECISIAYSHLSSAEEAYKTSLKPQTNTMILHRMLNNLRQIYQGKKRLPELLRVLQLQQVLTPKSSLLYRDIGVLHFQLGQWPHAAKALQAYLYECPQADDKNPVRVILREALGNFSRLN